MSPRQVFAFTHEGRHFVYGPLHKVLVEVDRPGADFLDDEVFLAEAGLTTTMAVPLDPPAPEQFSASSVSLFLTSACNLRCTYCYGRGGEHPQQMTWEMARSALDLAEQSRVGENLSVHFHGNGEPTLAFGLLKKCVAHARQISSGPVRFSIGTNGVMGVDEALWLAEHMNEATLSLDGCREVHDTQRPRPSGGGSWDHALRTAMIFEQEGLSYGIRVTVDADSVPRIPEMVEELCFSTGCALMRIEPVYQAGRATDHAPVDPRRFIEAFLQGRQIARSHRRVLGTSSVRPELVSSRFCRAAGQSFCVTPIGGATSCYEVTDPADLRSETFKFAHWEGRFFLDLDRWRQQWSLGPAPGCAECFCLWHCAGDCPAKWRDGAPDRSRCQITRSLTAAMLVERLEGSCATHDWLRIPRRRLDTPSA